MTHGVPRSAYVRRETDVLFKWGPGRMYTYVDGRKIRPTRTPGRCFLKAGWNYVLDDNSKPRLSKAGLHLLAKEPA